MIDNRYDICVCWWYRLGTHEASLDAVGLDGDEGALHLQAGREIQSEDYNTYILYMVVSFASIQGD